MANWTENQRPISAEQRLAAWNLSHGMDWQASLKRLRDAGFRESECASILGVSVEELWAERSRANQPDRPDGDGWTFASIRHEVSRGATIKRLCRITGIPESTAHYRIKVKGWTLEDAVTKPAEPRRESGKRCAAARRKSLERS